MKELLKLKNDIKMMNESIDKLVVERKELEQNAEQIQDKKSVFYRDDINKVKLKQSEIDEMLVKVKELKKNLEEKIENKKQKTIQKLEDKKTKIEKLATIDEKDKKISLLSDEKNELKKQMEKEQIGIERLKKIMENKSNIAKSILQQDLDRIERSYKVNKQKYEENNNELEILNINDPREEFIKIEKEINKIQKLNYDNIEEYIKEKEEQEKSTNKEEVEKNETENLNDIKDAAENENVKSEEEQENAAENDPDIQSQDEKLDDFKKEQERKEKIVDEIKKNINKDDKGTDKDKEDLLKLSLTDLQIKGKNDYNQAFKQMSEEVNKLYNNNKESITKLDNIEVDKLKEIYGISDDAAMLLNSRIRIGEFKFKNKEEDIVKESSNEVNKKESLWQRIKNKFSSNKDTNLPAKQNRFNQIFNKIKGIFNKNTYAQAEVKENQEDVKEETIANSTNSFIPKEVSIYDNGVDRLGNRTERTDEEKKADEKASNPEKEMENAEKQAKSKNEAEIAE